MILYCHIRLILSSESNRFVHTITINSAKSEFFSAIAAQRNNETTYTSIAAFEPIDELVRTDADVILTFLSGNGVITIKPLLGDWYRSADEPVTIYGADVTGEGGFEAYLPSEPASPMGCVSQYQFCSTEYPGLTGCGPLGSLREAAAGATPFFNTSYEEFATFVTSGNAGSAQTARYDYFVTVFFGISKSFDTILKQLGSAGLLSQKTIIGSQQVVLPTNQWQLDMRYLWDTSLATVQAGVVQHAYGPTDTATLESWLRFTGPEMEKMCNSQVNIRIFNPNFDDTLFTHVY